MFGPLSFEESESTNEELKQPCLLCSEQFDLQHYEQFLKHVFEAHNLVIDSVKDVSKLDKYVDHWKTRFNETSIESMVPSVNVEGTDKRYFVMSSLLPEDQQIRHKLKLESVLEQQEAERTVGGYKRNCLFCKLQLEGRQVDFVKHLSSQHNLHLGQPENLVFIGELLDTVEHQINSLRCIYCEKTFPERGVLKEHMRKKLHKRINPSNHAYDRFYVVNYLEPGRTWRHVQRDAPVAEPVPRCDRDSDQEAEPDLDQDWSDWNEKAAHIVCLFCDYRSRSDADVLVHMKFGHGFDLRKHASHLDFYQKVKLVNYVRRQAHVGRCPYCDRSFGGKQMLREHLAAEKHCRVPDLRAFDQPEYYFPTYENDALLYYLEEITDA